MKKLIIGLGNPGKKYANSKHNVGFMALDSFAKVKKLKFKPSIKFNSEIAELNNMILVKPKTYMNNSGYAIYKICDYYQIEAKDILVVYDDVALPLAKLRLRYKGSAGGHNGIKSLIEHLKTETFNRLRIGIDKDNHKEMKDYVLSDFSKVEKAVIEDAMIKVTQILEDFSLGLAFEEIMNKYNITNDKEVIE